MTPTRDMAAHTVTDAMVYTHSCHRTNAASPVDVDMRWASTVCRPAGGLERASLAKEDKLGTEQRVSATLSTRIAIG